MINRILRDRCNEFSLDGLKPPWGDRLVTFYVALKVALVTAIRETNA